MEPVFVLAVMLGGVPWDTALLEHEATLGKLQTLHAQLVLHGGTNTATYELWSDGDQDRMIQRLGDATSDSEETVRITATDGANGRSLSGWDPKKPFALPLDPGQNVSEFLTVRGAVGPIRSFAKRQHFWFLMGIDLLPGWSVAEIAQTSKVEPANDSETEPSFRVVTSSYAALQGIEFTMSRQYGFLVSQVMLPDGTVGSVEEFRDFDGLTLPARVKRQKAPSTTISELLSCTVNQPIPREALRLEFPEGARVDEPNKSLVHLWGKDAPQRTFANDESLQEFIVDAIAESQRPASQPMSERPGNSLLFWGNVGLLSLLAVLYVIRRRLSRS